MTRFALFLLLFAALTPAIRADDFRAGTYVHDGHRLPFRLLFPPGYDGSKAYPLVLFLHGSAERGDDNEAQLKNAVMHFTTPENRRDFPCFVLAPQCPANQKWSDVDWGAEFNPRPPEPSTAMQLALDCLDEVTTRYKIDKSRVYLCGISMGGYGAWDCLTRFPGKFAAGVPVCGGGDPDTVTAAVAQTPIWAFHSEDDPAVHITKTLRMIEAWKKMGGHPRFTEYHGLGHVCWEKAFSDPGLMPWLFAQRIEPPANP